MKPKSPEYKSGYGQCKSDTLLCIKEALIYTERNLEQARRDLDKPDVVEMLQHKREALKWVRSMVKTQRGDRSKDRVQ